MLYLAVLADDLTAAVASGRARAAVVWGYGSLGTWVAGSGFGAAGTAGLVESAVAEVLAAGKCEYLQYGDRTFGRVDTSKSAFSHPEIAADAILEKTNPSSGFGVRNAAVGVAVPAPQTDP